MEVVSPADVRGRIARRLRLKAWIVAAFRWLWGGLVAFGYSFATEGSGEAFDFELYTQLIAPNEPSRVDVDPNESSNRHNEDQLAAAVDRQTAHTPSELRPVPERTWRRMCAAEEVEQREGYRIATAPAVAVFRQGTEFFCTDDACTHGAFSLSEGYVDSCVVECALHLGRFSLRTGKAVSTPAFIPLNVHPVAVVSDEVYAALPDSYLAPPSD